MSWRYLYASCRLDRSGLLQLLSLAHRHATVQYIGPFACLVIRPIHLWPLGHHALDKRICKLDQFQPQQAQTRLNRKEIKVQKDSMTSMRPYQGLLLALLGLHVINSCDAMRCNAPAVCSAVVLQCHATEIVET